MKIRFEAENLEVFVTETGWVYFLPDFPDLDDAKLPPASLPTLIRFLEDVLRKRLEENSQ